MNILPPPRPGGAFLSCDTIPSMKKLIVGNWKMNPETPEMAKLLYAELGRIRSKTSDMVICPPFPYLHLAKPKAYALGAQDVFWEQKGAYTGEVSPGILKGFGVSYVIIGHSERRTLVGETDEMIARKLKAAATAGLKAILCVGEDAEMRTKGLTAAKRFVEKELREDLVGVKANGLIIAYEPIWAISGGVIGKPADSPADAAEMAEFIKSRVPDAKVLYGGSVNAGNARDFLKQPEIDGALVGGASLRGMEFKQIVTSLE
jgi:triosephosphate isomerase (TIM)